MAALRGDQYVKLPSLSKALGMQRTGVRESAPQGQDRDQVKEIVNALCRNRQQRTAAIVLLARATGMRLRETVLAELSRPSREVNDLCRINHSKWHQMRPHGASAPHWITVGDLIRDAHGFVRQGSSACSRNLIAPNESYLNVLQEVA